MNTKTKNTVRDEGQIWVKALICCVLLGFVYVSFLGLSAMFEILMAWTPPHYRDTVIFMIAMLAFALIPFVSWHVLGLEPWSEQENEGESEL